MWTQHLPKMGLCAFLCAFWGTLLWVRGGSGWYFYRTGGHSGFLGGIYASWVLLYALYGMLLAVVPAYRTFGRHCGGIRAGVLLFLSYFLSLLWYAVFFCTRLTVFGSVVLAAAAGTAAAVCAVSDRRYILLHMVLIMIILVEICYLWHNVYFALAI